MYIVWNEVYDLEALLEKNGIHEYAKFICGYHIHGASATNTDPSMCALDWYFQSAKQRGEDKQVWEHSLILDQVCPTKWYLAAVVLLQDENYVGWDGHKVGMESV